MGHCAEGIEAKPSGATLFSFNYQPSARSAKQMPNINSLWGRAVKQFGLQNISAMANTCGATNGTLEDVPTARIGDLENVLGRMLRDGASQARASADFAEFRKANAEMTGHGDDDDDDDDAPETNAAGFPVSRNRAPAPRESGPAATLDDAAIRQIWNRWNHPKPTGGKRPGE
jgi:hypothetical protein